MQRMMYEKNEKKQVGKNHDEWKIKNEAKFMKKVKHYE